MEEIVNINYIKRGKKDLKKLWWKFVSLKNLLKELEERFEKVLIEIVIICVSYNFLLSFWSLLFFLLLNCNINVDLYKSVRNDLADGSVLIPCR